MEPTRQVPVNGARGFGQFDERQLSDVLSVLGTAESTAGRGENKPLIPIDQAAEGISILAEGVFLESLLIRHPIFLRIATNPLDARS